MASLELADIVSVEAAKGGGRIIVTTTNDQMWSIGGRKGLIHSFGFIPETVSFRERLEAAISPEA